MSRTPVAFGPFVITRRIARGGMAEIYRAKRKGSSEWVAIKMMRPSLEHEELREQLFAREARVASAIRHPNVVALLDYGEELGHRYLAMEYVRGRDLSHLVKGPGDGPPITLPYELVLTLVMKAARGLGHAHRLIDPATQAPLGIVHRDISPGNVMIGYDGQVKVLDFGVARINEEGGLQTQSGTLRGKFAYMSPEQTVGAAVDAKSDVFSLGTVLYELLTGSNPFRAKNPVATLDRVQRVRPVPPSRSNRSVGPEVDEILARCLAKDPRRRFADAGELADALAALLAKVGEASEDRIAELMRTRFGWELAEEDKELREEEEGVSLIEVVDFALGATDVALDAPNVAEVAEPSVAEPLKPESSAVAEEDAYGVFDERARSSWMPEAPPVEPPPPQAPLETAAEAETAVMRAVSRSPTPRIVPAPLGAEEAGTAPGVVGDTSARAPAELEAVAREETDTLLRALADVSTQGGRAPARAPPRRALRWAVPVAAVVAIALATGTLWWPEPEPRLGGKLAKKIEPVAIAVEAPVSLTAASSAPAPGDAALPAGELEGDEDPPPEVRSTPPAGPIRERLGLEEREPGDKRRAPAKRGSGFLNVGAKPWAEIEIDGRRWPYQTPQAGIELSAGKHTVRLTNPETKVSKTAVVFIKPGASRTLNLDLRSE